MMTREKLFQKLIEVVGIRPELAEADFILSMSEVLKDVCVEVGVPADRIVVLGNRVSTSHFFPQPQVDCDPGTIRLLFIGRLEPQKNLDGIARALVMLEDEGWMVRLDICGGRGVNPYLRQALAVLQPSDWRYWGPVANDDLPARYAAADMYVGPSHFEGFQIPLIESLACGRPCVASDQPPANEIIDREVGELVDPDDAASIAAGIRRLKERLNDAAERSAIRDACRRRAEDRWSYEAVSQREVEIYCRAIDRAKAFVGGTGQ